MLRKVTFVIMMFMAVDPWVDGSQDVVMNLSINYAKALETCMKELNLPESIKDDFKDFWKQDFMVTSRDTGCAFHCLSTKLDLLDPDGSLHHGNAEEFVRKHGADDVVAKQLLDIIHKCEDENPDSDMCLKTMKLANCFKVEVYKMDWVPDLDVIMAEIVVEA